MNEVASQAGDPNSSIEYPLLNEAYEFHSGPSASLLGGGYGRIRLSAQWVYDAKTDTKPSKKNKGILKSITKRIFRTKDEVSEWDEWAS